MAVKLTDTDPILGAYEKQSDEETKVYPARPGFCREHRFAIALFGFLLVLTFSLAVSYAVVEGRDSGSSPPPPEPVGETWDFDDAFNTSLAPRYAYINWLQSEDAYTEVNAAGSIIKYTLPDFTPTTLILGTNIKYNGQSLNWWDYHLSYDGQYLLFQADHESLYRYSSLDVYYIWNMQTQVMSQLASGQKLQLAIWSPQGHRIAYVLNNNIYIFDVDLGETYPVTNDGAVNSVLNGLCDWVYEEEIFGTSVAMYWSPDGNKLAYLKFVETAVPTYQFSEYEIPYNEEIVYKYPKSGEVHSIVTLYFYDIPLNETVQGNVGNDPDEYIVEVQFFGTATLAVRTMPRIQNSSIVLAIDTTSGASRILSTTSSKWWLEPASSLRYFPAQGYYIDLVVSQDQAHIALYDALTGNFVRWLTQSSEWGVRSIIAINANLNLVYYTSTEYGPEQRPLESVTLAGLDAAELAPVDFGISTWQSASFSASGTYFLLNEQGELPQAEIREVTMQRTSITLRVLQDNSAMWNNLAPFALPVRVGMSVPGAKITLFANMYQPAGFDESCNTKYPVLIYVYGGPGSQTVTQMFPYGTGTLGWHLYMSSTHKFLIFQVDGIGTGGRTDSFEKNYTYLNLGVNEALDVITATQWLRSQCYVDTTRIALWGWSYGGYLSSMVASDPQANQLFRSIIAVAPVVDWRLYDNIYTERYMQTPAANPLGYNTSSVLYRLQLNPSSFMQNYLLVHGTSDDNVHFQNSALLAQALQQEEIQFETMFYTNRNHGLRGPQGQANKHLYRMFTHFLLTTMDLEDCGTTPDQEQ